MVDDVLRMRATVVSDQALAELRKIGREIGIVGQRGAPGIKTINTEFARLGQTVRNVGRELTQAIPALGGLGLGAAGVGLALGTLARTMGDTAKRVVELASKELGMSERDLRAYQSAAQKVGISAESMTSGLQAFVKTTHELKIGIGSARDELYAMGAGPIVARMNAAKTTAEKLKVAFDFGKVLDQNDPTGFKKRTFYEQTGLGADKARLSLEELNAEIAKHRERSPEEQAAAKRYSDALVDLGNKWEDLKTKAGAGLFPKMEATIRELEKIIGLIETIANMIPGGAAQAGKPGLADDPTGWAADKLLNFNKQLPVSPNRSPRSGYKPTAFGGGEEMSDGTRMVKEGVFAALVEFMSYVQTGGQAGGAGGFTPASFGGSAGAAAGGGAGGGGRGWGGGGYSVVPDSGDGTTPGVSGGGQGAGRGSAVGGVPNTPGTPGESSVQGAVTPKGGGRSGYNYFQHRGDAPIRDPSKLATVDTAYGPAKVHPEAADDFKKTADALSAAGAPIGKWGSYNYRQKRWGGGWSSHAYGAALDVGDRASMSPQMKAWIRANPEKWKAALAAGNYGQPLTDASMTGGKDAPHIEWRGPRGEKDPQQAAANTGRTGAGGSAADRKTVKGSYFGSAPGWPKDPSEPASRPTAGGYKNTIPGIALPADQYGKPKGQMYEVTGPDGKTMMLPHIDSGPHRRTRRGIDITAAGAAAMGYTSKTFPTDGGFSYRRVDEQIAGKQEVNGQVKVTVNSNGTAARTSASADGLWQKTTVENYKQMQPTNAPANSVEAGP